MKKLIKKWGEGLGIYFDKEDIKIHKFKEGNIIDISDFVLVKKNKETKSR